MAPPAIPPPTASRVSQRARKLTARAKQSAEDDAEATAQRKSSGGSSRKRAPPTSDVENRGPVAVGAQNVASRDRQEFEFQTLASNRTSLRAAQSIKLNAHMNGIPRVKTPPVVKKVAGQRHSEATPPPTQRRLSPSSARRLAEMRNPYQSPMQHSYQGHGDSRSTLPSSSGLPQTPLRPVASTHFYSDQPATSTAYVSNRAPPSSSIASTPARAQDAHPVPNMAPPPVHPRTSLAEYHITSMANTEHLAQLPTVSSQEHEPSYDAQLFDPDDGMLDPDDYAIHPRARAHALAYGSAIENVGINTADHHLDPEALAEMDKDPDADQEDGDTLSSARLRGDLPRTFSPGMDDPQSGAEDETIEMSTMSHRRVRPVDESDEDEDERPARRRRAASPANSEPDAQHPQAQVLQQKDANKKPVARDYEPRAQAILDRAFTLYKVKLTKLNAYPDKLKERTWAKQAWAEAAQDLKINLIPDERALVLIMRYTCNLRGEIKGGARALVQSTYGFQSAATKDSKEGRANRAHAEYLLANRRFTYKDPVESDGLYEHPIIQSLVNRVYYKHPTDDGIIHQDHYNIFPLAGIALILTAVHCAIQEWSTGVFDAVRFEEGKFVSIYVEHVDNLKEYEMKSEDDRIVSELGRQLAETGRAHAKAPPQSVSNSEGISSSDIDRAVAAYRLRKRRERDGLN